MRVWGDEMYNVICNKTKLVAAVPFLNVKSGDGHVRLNVLKLRSMSRLEEFRLPSKFSNLLILGDIGVSRSPSSQLLESNHGTACNTTMGRKRRNIGIERSPSHSLYLQVIGQENDNRKSKAVAVA